MSAIKPPKLTYKPSIAQSIIDNGVLSDVQLEAISYAGQSHAQKLPDGSRRGFFIGDGTGVGKGREISGILLDNYNKGQKKAVWVTVNEGLLSDAKRDISALFGNSDLVTQFKGGANADKSLSKDEAILFVGYDTLAAQYDNKGSNLDKIVNWLGKDFDGVIAFDESHKMANSGNIKGARGTKKASGRALAGIELQKRLPNAKIVYASATGATEVGNLAYLERLGLWGEGTAFSNSNDFVDKIQSGGIAAMELVARDLKAMGVYLSRNISYDGVKYSRLQHKLTKEQRKVYDKLADAWQIVFQNTEKALRSTNQDKDGHARGMAASAFWSSQQRFFNQIMTSMQMPTVIKDIEKQLDSGKSVVLQLTSTNEAAQNRQLALMTENGKTLDDYDATPSEVLMDFVQKSFPVEQYETYKDDKGNIKSRKAYDSNGKPVLNREAVKAREKLLDELGSIPMPSSPLNMIIDHFGTDMAAENTGRSRRVITKDGKRIVESLSQSKRNADVDDFQQGKKRIIVFSEAGGTGKSYHADKFSKNQQQRVHYVLEAGWKADSAVQGFGRSHRSNQAVTPEFKLVTTDLKGQNRFISTIARRLNQLGALTKGQRQAGSQGLFDANDSLEGSLAADTLAGYYKALAADTVQDVEGRTAIKKMGLEKKLFDEYGRFSDTAPEVRDISKFLNRLLILKTDEQNAVFDGFAEALQVQTDIAEQNGMLDKGLENYKADSVHLNDIQEIRSDKLTGAKTLYYDLTSEHKITPLKFEDIRTQDKSFEGFYVNKNTNAVKAVFKTSSTTNAAGDIIQRYRLEGQHGKEYIIDRQLKNSWEKINDTKAEKLWNEAVAELPATEKRSLHLIGGAVLPVWDKLPNENTRIVRVLTDTGETLIGRVIPDKELNTTLRRIGATRKKLDISTPDLISQIKSGNTAQFDNGWKIVKRRVSNENRLEVIGATYNDGDMLESMGVFKERIGYVTRFFIPYNTNSEAVMNRILNAHSLTSIGKTSENSYSKEALTAEKSDRNERWQTTEDKTADKKIKAEFNSLDDIRKYLSEGFNIPISSGKVQNRSARGVFKNTSETIRTRTTDDIPTIAHEVGHYLNKKYGLSESEHVGDAINAADKEFLDQYKEGERPSEAVAEFLRVYMQNRSKARDIAPDFYDDFINALDKKDLNILNTAAKAVNKYMSSTFDERVANSIVTNKKASQKGIGDKISEAKRKILSEIVDGFMPIKEATEYVKKVEGGLSGERDSYILATNSRNASSIADYILKQGMTDIEGNINIGNSFIECIKDIPEKKLEKFDEYLVLRHSLEWIEPRDGAAKKRVFADDTLENVKEIKESIAKLEKANPSFKASAENLYKYQQNVMRNFAVQSGGMSADLQESLNEMYPNYVPFYRATETNSKNVKSKAGFANQKIPVMRAKGSGAPILSPLESIAKNTEKMVKFATRNRVMQTLAQYADNVDGFGQFMEKVPPDMMPKTIKTGDYIKKIEETLEGELSGKDLFAVSSVLDNIIGDEIVSYTPVADPRKRIVTVLRNGKAEYYQVHDESLYNAITELSPQQMGALITLSQKIMNPMKMLITTFNPVFATSNPIRDFDTAYKNSVINNPVEFIANYALAIKDMIVQSDEFKQYKALGGGHASDMSATRDIIRRDLQRIGNKDMGLARRTLDTLLHPVHLTSELNDFTEAVPRYAEFKAVKKRSGDVHKALYAADDITVNFKRSGAGGRKLNSVLMFNNAAVQGISKLYRSFKDATPTERWLRIGKYVAEAVMTTALLAWLNRRDEEAEEDYNNLSKYVKNNYYAIYIGDGKFIKIPKARETALLNSFLERVMDAFKGDEEAFYQFGEYLAETLLPPMIPYGSSPVDIVHNLAGDTVLGGFTDVGFNKNYMGIPIESKSMEYEPRANRYKESTTKLARTLGQSWFGEFTDLSPLQIDYLLSNYTGIIGQANKALFPVNDELKDKTIGFKNKYVADSVYSEDKTDKAYDARDKEKEKFLVSPTPENAIAYEKSATQAGFISGMLSAIKQLPEDEQREGRELMLDFLDTWNKGDTTGLEGKAITKLKGYEGKDIKYYMGSLPDNTLERTIDGVKYKYEMKPSEYVKYTKDLLAAVKKVRNLVLQSSSTGEECALRLESAVSEAKKAVNDMYKDKYIGTK